MPFETILDQATAGEKSVVVYAPTPAGTDLAERLQTRNARIRTRPLPRCFSAGFVIVRDREGFRGAVSLAAFEEFLEPPIHRPGDLSGLHPGNRAVFELLDDTLFVSLDRRQLLGTSREIEDRAWRYGTGQLHAGFQRREAFEAQRDIYRDLARTTDVTVHVYLADQPAGVGATTGDLRVHYRQAAHIAQFWFLLYDSGPATDATSALVARQQSDREYRGIWTHNPALVQSAIASLE